MAGEIYIDFNATGQKLERTDEKTVAAGAANALYCRFSLDDGEGLSFERCPLW